MTSRDSLGTSQHPSIYLEAPGPGWDYPLAPCQPCISRPTRIVDWDSFHDVFAEALGFPDFYGRNMNAWVDCLKYRESPGDGMANVNVEPGDTLVLQIDGAAAFRDRCPQEYSALIECSAFANWSKLDMGERPILILAFWK